ncbi:MAG TPA: c-type cytochrome [Planctomycetota bacterium]
MEPAVNRTIPTLAFVFFGVCIVLTFVVRDRGPTISREPTDPLVQRGQDVYRKVCLQCHHANPMRDGTGAIQGPAIADASLELLEARVLRNEYPKGYKPKRATRNMTAFPSLAPDIPALHAFLTWSRQ